MLLFVDSREKWTQVVRGRKPDTHISAYLDRHKIPWVVQKLEVGDYMLEGGTVTVDRKQNVEEISRNLTNPNDKLRFWNEVRLARRIGLRLVVVIEDNKRKAVSDLRGWHSAYSPVTGAVLIRQMERLRHSYGVENIHPHRFRRTLATNLIAHGMPVQEVAAILGHDKLDTTMRYVVLDQSATKNAYRKYA